MTGNLSTTQSVRQSTRQLMSVASDKMKLASSAVARSDTRELDVAVIKSTTPQFHVIPKEKHVRTLKDIVHNGTKDHVRETVKMLLERLKGATDWLTALKSLMVFHRLMRECSTIFLNALVQYSTNKVANAKGKGLFNMGNFLDTTNIDGRFDFSEWVRGYGKYLDEQLEVYQELNFYPEMEHGGDSSRMRTLSGDQLLKQLPVLQRLQQRLMDCKPSGAAAHDPVVQAALMAVLKESFKVYKAISEGIINLADRFFEMEYLDAQRGLDIYKESIVENKRLQEYYREVEQIEELKRGVQFPKLESLPPDFLTQMEEYVREAPRPLEEAASASKKGAPIPDGLQKSPPLRRGTKAAGGKGPSRFENAASGFSTGTASDPGMIGTFSSKTGDAEAAKPAAAEPNLLDFDELTISEPSPATTGPSSTPQNGFSSHLSPAGDYPGFEPLPSPFSAQDTSHGLAHGGGQPPNQFGSSSFTSEGGFPSPGSESNPFGPASNYSARAGGFAQPAGSFQAAANTAPQPHSTSGSASAMQQFPSGLPQTHAAPDTGRGGGPMVPQQQQGLHPGYSGFNSSASGVNPQISGLSSNASQGFAYPSAAPVTQTPAYSAKGGFGSSGIEAPTGISGFGEQLLGSRESQLGEFGANIGHAGSPPFKPPPGAVVAAGLTRPTNVALAKEAALHDPFAGLSDLKPSTAQKTSPPLKHLLPSPGSIGQPANNALRGPHPGAMPQPSFGQVPTRNSYQSFGGDANGLGPPAFGVASPPVPSSGLQVPPQRPATPPSFDDNRGNSLI